MRVEVEVRVGVEGRVYGLGVVERAQVGARVAVAVGVGGWG